MLHACCAPCATHVIDILSQTYELTILFYNPNIQPANEHKKRSDDIKKLCNIKNIELLMPENYPEIWLQSIKGYESEPEGKERCSICFNVRFKKAAETAAMSGQHKFTTTLTVSPHKDPKVINSIGRTVANEFGVTFLEADFKKNKGYKKSCDLSRKYGLYRQKYCGCLYSIR